MLAQEKWIQLGYEVFASSGPDGLKVERLAKTMGVSKSSFYHYFAEMEVFEEALLKRHLQQTGQMAEKEKQVQTIDPGLIGVLLEHKTDLLFNRQLRFHKDKPQYRKILERSNKIVGQEFVTVWMRCERFELTEHQVSQVYELALEHFFLQLTAENLNYEWLSAYFKQLNKMTRSLV